MFLFFIGRPQVSKDSSAKEEDDFETPTMSFESFLTYDAPTSVKKKKKPLPSSSSSTSHSRSSHSISAHHKSAPQAVPSSSSSSSKANKAHGNKRSHSGSNLVAAMEVKRRRVGNTAQPDQSFHLCSFCRQLFISHFTSTANLFSVDFGIL